MEPTREQNLKAFDDAIQLLWWFSLDKLMLPLAAQRMRCKLTADMLDGERDDYASRTAEEADNSDLAGAVISGVRQTLIDELTEVERGARIAECQHLYDSVAKSAKTLWDAGDILRQRLHELEAEEE